jgi:acyl-CoA thioesterase-2
MLRRAHPEPAARASMAATSLDHSIWIHGPVRFDRWHAYTQETVAFTGHRGLVRGSIHDADGHLVATVMQEGMVRPTL